MDPAPATTKLLMGLSRLAEVGPVSLDLGRSGADSPDGNEKAQVTGSSKSGCPVPIAGAQTRFSETTSGPCLAQSCLFAGQRIAAEQGRNATLGAQSLRVLQLEKAMGRPPELKDFGRPAFEWRSEILADDPLEAWQQFLAAVHAELEAYSAAAPGTLAVPAASRSPERSTPTTATSPSTRPHGDMQNR
jgi:hypothetical protein